MVAPWVVKAVAEVNVTYVVEHGQPLVQNQLAIAIWCCGTAPVHVANDVSFPVCHSFHSGSCCEFVNFFTKAYAKKYLYVANFNIAFIQ